MAYLYTGMNTLLPLGAAAAMERNGSPGLEPLSLALVAYGLAAGPFTGLFYFQDYNRAFLRSSVNVMAGSLMLAGTGTMVGNLFSTGENSTGLHVLGWMGMAGGGLGLLGNSMLGIGDIPKARKRFLARLKPTLSYGRNRDGKMVSAIRLDVGLL
jgi:hypothetical protein